MPLPPGRNEYSAVMEGGPISPYRSIGLWRRFYGRLDYEDPLQKTIAASGLGTLFMSTIGIVYSSTYWQPVHLGTRESIPLYRVFHTTITRFSVPGFAAGTLFGFGVTMSAIMRGNKDGEINHAIGALCASSVLAMRGNAPLFITCAVFTPLIAMLIKNFYAMPANWRVERGVKPAGFLVDRNNPLWRKDDIF